MLMEYQSPLTSCCQGSLESEVLAAWLPARPDAPATWESRWEKKKLKLQKGPVGKTLEHFACRVSIRQHRHRVSCERALITLREGHCTPPDIAGPPRAIPAGGAALCNLTTSPSEAGRMKNGI